MIIKWKSVVFGCFLAIIISTILSSVFDVLLGIRIGNLWNWMGFLLAAVYVSYSLGGGYLKEGVVYGVLIGLIGGVIGGILSLIALWLINGSLELSLTRIILDFLVNAIVYSTVSAIGGIIGLLLTGKSKRRKIIA
ncbi:DUF5518 domain-containing protein [Methanobacterium congolense]|uniref:Region of a membrane-bound protein predicted to be embedded in the membrane n=1 Tax=Methanobacterium congolense TaxID=118062 RepID=A0A1D3L171_9EURY|nr:DUF5518 domain-containing protein [Methanobacterium congolense]SCG85180.1 Region of a membrane-bound protein predicted to be embedded in the membrane [Methanobacterium congolense]